MGHDTLDAAPVQREPESLAYHLHRLSRPIVLADRPFTSPPNNVLSASSNAPVEIPLRYKALVDRTLADDRASS